MISIVVATESNGTYDRVGDFEFDAVPAVGDWFRYRHHGEEPGDTYEVVRREFVTWSLTPDDGRVRTSDILVVVRKVTGSTLMFME